MHPVLLENLPWPEIATLRDQNGGLLLLPLGATEQHGPHLPVAMDSLMAEKTCHEVSARTGVPVLPTLRYTVSQGHTAKWPGTFSLTHATFIATLNEPIGRPPPAGNACSSSTPISATTRPPASPSIKSASVTLESCRSDCSTFTTSPRKFRKNTPPTQPISTPIKRKRN